MSSRQEWPRENAESTIGDEFAGEGNSNFRSQISDFRWKRQGRAGGAEEEIPKSQGPSAK